mmetsp:Transcript_18893/g.43949  ORF Transcript_18893/g.43949 Transcript_18893/m.43949 type:complete len:101 (-) Transcript_18893:187-489(-)
MDCCAEVTNWYDLTFESLEAVCATPSCRQTVLERCEGMDEGIVWDMGKKNRDYAAAAAVTVPIGKRVQRQRRRLADCPPPSAGTKESYEYSIHIDHEARI